MTDDIRLCPECGAEFHAHVAACSDCGTALVAPDAPDPLALAFDPSLVAVSYPDGPMARRYADALGDAGISSCAHWVTFADESEDQFLFVRPEDEAGARRLAAEVEMPTVDLREMELDRAAVDVWFAVPDLAPGLEEATATEKAKWGVAFALGGVFMVLLGVFAVGSPATAWAGVFVVVAGLAWQSRQRALADRLRVERERTAVGIMDDAEALPARLDDGPTSHLGI